jgi:hypothetical protein
MITNIEKVYEEAMRLPNESKALLAERIINFIGTHVDPDIESVHLDIVKQRRDEMRKGQVKAIDVRDASIMARRIIYCIEGNWITII